MNAPDPKANTTTEAYLAYKAGYLEESELKPVLYEPYLHFGAWLAYWAGLTNTYPNNGVPIGKNLFDKKEAIHGALLGDGKIETIGYPIAGVSGFIKVEPGDTYVVSGRSQWSVVGFYDADNKWIRRTTDNPVTIPAGCYWIRVGFQWPLDLDTVQVEEGDTATTYEAFKGEPEMLCDEEALVAYLAGVTDTYPEDIKDPYDVRIVGYLKHLASIRWPEPDYPVNNEEFYLSTMEPTHTSNSEPSADIELDTAEGKVLSVEAYGDTYQQTYSGKNLLDIPDGYTGTSGGVTTTWSNNIATSNATSATSTTCSLTSTLAFKSTTLPAGTYTFSVQSSTSQYYPILRLRDTSDTWHNYSITAGENSVTITTDYSANAAQLSLGLWTAGTAITNFVTEYPMLEVGSTATSYEPYTGEVPSPNPDYPQTVDVVTGTQTVNVNGKNLFDRANAVENMILGWANANDVTENGSLVAHEYMLVSEGDTFASNYGMCVFFFDSNDNYLGCLLSGGTTIGKQTGTYVRTFTVPSGYGIAKMKIEYRHNLGGNPSDMTSVTDIMLNTGNRVLPYEPYQSYTVDLGNIELCRIGEYQDYIYKDGDDWYLHKDTGKTIVTGDSSEGWTAQTSNVGYMYRLTLQGVDSVLASDMSNLVSDYFTAIRGGAIYNVTSGGYIAQLTVPGYIRFSIGDTTNKLSEFRTWLGTHNTTIYYALATPTDTKITDSTLIGQLDALAGADTYDGKTYIKVTANDPNLPVLLKVEAYKY